MAPNAGVGADDSQSDVEMSEEVNVQEIEVEVTDANIAQQIAK